MPRSTQIDSDNYIYHLSNKGTVKLGFFFFALSSLGAYKRGKQDLTVLKITGNDV